MPKEKKIPNYFAFIAGVLGLIIVLLLAIAIIGSIQDRVRVIPLSTNNTQTKIKPGVVSTVQEQTLSQPKLDSNSPVLGDAKAPISIFEYSSFSCPNSKQIQSTLESIIKLYPKKVKLIWKDLPLTQEYPTAMIAHINARCAQKQGKFWEYSNLLWQNQDNFSTSTALNLAKVLKLDSNAFKDCLQSQEIKNLIAKDEQEASDLAIPGTPHFYINTQEISGVGSIDDFKRIIEAELNRK